MIEVINNILFKVSETDFFRTLLDWRSDAQAQFGKKNNEGLQIWGV